MISLFYLCLVFQLGLLQVLLASDVETMNIYLNSYAHCGHDKTFAVSLRKEYFIQPNISPNTGTNSFRTCEVTFYASEPDGHICLIQEGNKAKITDNNAELQVFDGVGSTDEKYIGNLKPFPDSWPQRDVCSTGRYITFYLREIKKENSADIRKIHLAFRVVDIKSRKRTLYLDGTSCNNKYDLLDSRINLRNRPQFPGMIINSPTLECPMMFKKVEPKSNSSICIVYVPSSNVTCDSQWQFAVYNSPHDFDNHGRYKVYNLSCSDSRANEMHVWCGDKAEKITAIFNRKVTFLSNSSLEPPGEFRFLVTDYKGTAAKLLSKVRDSLTVVESGGFDTLEIVLICVCVALVLVLIIIVFVNRRKLPCYRYKAVAKRDSDANDARM